MHWSLGLAGVAVLTVAAPVAAGDPPSKTDAAVAPGTEDLPDESDGRQRAHQRWYGWQPLLLDVANTATAVTALVGNSHADVGYLVVPVYLVGGPLIHGAHGRWSTAATSLGLRAALPATAGAIGFATASGCESGLCSAAGLFIGLCAGAAIAPIIDASLLSTEHVSGDAIVVGVAPAPGGATLGASGSF